MKQLYFILLGIVFLANIQNLGAQPNWQWATSASGDIDDYPRSICNDASGNTYVVGSFNSSTLTLGSIVLTTFGFHDMFIAKYNSQGQVLWANNSGGSDGEYASTIGIDASGNIYVVGYFTSASITFGSYTLSNNSNAEDIFLVKYDPAGNVLWAKKAGGNNRDDKPYLCIDQSDNIYISGSFYSDTISFDGITVTKAGSGKDVFIAKYNTAGNAIWAKTFGGSDDDYANSISNDQSGNIYITGQYLNASIIIDSITLPNNGDYDIFIAKFNSLGNVAWAKSAGGNRSDIPYTIKIDPSNNIYYAGSFSSDSIIFGPTQLMNTSPIPTIPFSTDIWLAKLDSSGNQLWVKQYGSLESENPTGLEFDNNGNVYMIGGFYGPSISFDGHVLINAGGTCFPADCPDIFLAALTPSGNTFWAYRNGGNNYDAPYTISIDNSDNLFLAGSFYEDTLVFGSTTLISIDNYDIFLAGSSLPVGMNELNNFRSTLKSFPNPCSGKVSFGLPVPEINGGELKIYNTFGKTVFTKRISDSADLLNLDVSSLGNGVYFCDLMVNKTRHFSCKLAVIH